MRFKIHRNSKETGGSCVEIWTDKTRIVIDTGTPAEGEGILPDIPSLYEEGGNTALFISHSDKDHYALIKNIHPSCPVWMGRTTHWLIRKKCAFLGGEFRLTNVHSLDYMNSVKIEDIEVHACMTDNSSFDDYSFFILDEACGEKMFFMCNARHREKRIFDYFLKKHNPETDYLLIENNSTGGNDENFQTEEYLLEVFIQTFRQTKGINLVFVSETDIARIETVYRACVRCQKIFLTDFYTASVLKTINKKARDTVPFPSRENFPEIFVYYPAELLMITEERKKEKEFIDHFLYKKHVFYNFYLNELDKKADRTVMLVSPNVQSDLEKHLHRYSDGCFIYSMREEHRQNENNRKFFDFIAGKGMETKKIHASARVDSSALKQTVETLKPKQIVHIYD